jgi:hypothetical protein
LARIVTSFLVYHRGGVRTFPSFSATVELPLCPWIFLKNAVKT